MQLPKVIIQHGRARIKGKQLIIRRASKITYPEEIQPKEKMELEKAKYKEKIKVFGDYSETSESNLGFRDSLLPCSSKVLQALEIKLTFVLVKLVILANHPLLRNKVR
ncbi:hypothetical protein E2542_SST23151 [Spatholobus suberectus]|nr:hypothetical protein E2542_SST23151 [Spatholobus suberectus]